MARIKDMKHLTASEIKELIAQIEDVEPVLNEWEEKFMESIKENIEDEKRITEKQEDCLQRIYDKVTKEEGDEEEGIDPHLFGEWGYKD